MNNTQGLVSSFLLAFSLSACSSHPPLLGDPELPYGDGPGEPVVGEMLHMPTGTKLDNAQMLALVDDAHYIFVGEAHDNPASHRLQEEVLEHVIEQTDGQVVLAMEMFTPSQQEALDRWSAGELDERSFLKEVNWFENWSMDFAYYRPLLEIARKHGIKVLGANAEKDKVRLLSRKTLEELSDEERATLPQLMDMSDPYQQGMVEAVYAGHGPSKSRLDGFRRIQTLWDESMAENVANYLQTDEGSGKKVVLTAGGNHVRYGYGVPRRLFKRLPASYIILGTEAIEVPESKKSQYMDIDVPSFPMVPYDVVRFVRYEELPEQGVKMGVMLSTHNDAVVISSVVEGTPAQRAGLQGGDTVKQFNGIVTESQADLLYELKQLNPGDRADISVQRLEETLKFTLEF